MSTDWNKTDPSASGLADQLAAAYLGRDHVNRIRSKQAWQRRRDRYMDTVTMVTCTVLGAALAAAAVGLAVLVWGWAL